MAAPEEPFPVPNMDDEDSEDESRVKPVPRLGSESVSVYYNAAKEKLNAEEVAQIEQAFERFDKDGNGVLDMDEVEMVLQELGKEMTRDQIQDLFFDVDLRNTGTIDKKVFLLMMSGEKSFRMQALQEDEVDMVNTIFNLFDSQKRGVWDYQAFQNYFRALENDSRVEISESEFQDLNRILGKEADFEFMGLTELQKFYTIQDRTVSSDLNADYQRIAE